MAEFQLNVNNKVYPVKVDEDTPLLWVIRDTLKLKGTKYGCGTADCGACTIHLNGSAVRSCVMPVKSVGKGKITTIEGLSEAGDHPLQRAWVKEDVSQCGYCQAGQLMTAAALLARKKKPTSEEIDAAMSGNICRCGTYQRIKKAIRSVSQSRS